MSFNLTQSMSVTQDSDRACVWAPWNVLLIQTNPASDLPVLVSGFTCLSIFDHACRGDIYRRDLGFYSRVACSIGYQETGLHD